MTTASHVKVAHAYATFLDNRFRFLGVRFGAASLIVFIPGIGDVLDVILACYLLWIAKKIHLPEKDIQKMIRNIIVAFVMGLFPLLGDVGYLMYKPNMRNFHILSRYAARVKEGEIVA